MLRKLLVILILFVLFSSTVYGLFKIEEVIREKRRVVVEIPPKEIIPENLTLQDIVRLQPEVQLNARARGDYLEIYHMHPGMGQKPGDGWHWEPLFLKGVNLGVALPGHFPAEFAASYQDYYRWLELIGQMGANVVRVYTILPPEFYQALSRYNFLNSHQPVYLLQGIWADLPEDGNYYRPDYLRRFQKEIKDAIDVVFGRAELPERPGHASGHYNRDVSAYTIGFILGREWEPKTVREHNALNLDRTRYNGFFFSVPQGSPMEVWLAEMMDFTMKYETITYHYQHPLSFVNWLPLDPMYHNSEFIESPRVREYDNDLLSLDFRHIYVTPQNQAGLFASYHAYPYYPDFVYNDYRYRHFQTEHGECHYAGYLHHLKQYLPDIPLVIAEFGVPSSRGNSHYDPNGFHQGGHTEQEQGRLNAHLIRDIYQQGGAGAILFEWIDEWFKFNWLVMDFEQPAQRRKLWHNLENPEQNFGLVAMEQAAVEVDGLVDDWKEKPLVQSEGILRAVYAQADAGHFYLRLSLPPHFDWQNRDVLVGIDTYSSRLGDHRFPGVPEETADGLEFLLVLRDTSHAALLVDEPYSVFTDIYHDFIPGYHSVENRAGKFVEQRLLANRQRIQLDGTVVPQIIHYRSTLRFGRSNPHLDDFNSLADWYYNPETGEVEVRLTWHLLNVTDPSSHQVLDNDPDTPEIETATTDGFRFYFLIQEGDSVLQKLPDSFRQHGIRYLWKGWEKPWYRMRLKPSYYLVRDAFQQLPPIRENSPRRSIPFRAEVTPWPQGKAGAVSITFDDGTYGIYRYAFPILQKYQLPATLGVIVERIGKEPLLTGDRGGFLTRYLTWDQLKKLSAAGWEIASHGMSHVNLRRLQDDMEIEQELTRSKKELEEKLGQPVVTFHYPFSGYDARITEMVRRSSYLFARLSGNRYNLPREADPYLLHSFVIRNEQTPTTAQLIHWLQKGQGKWTILMYHHVFPEDSRELRVMESHRVRDTYSVTPSTFERHARIIRNSDYYVGTIADVGTYLEMARQAQVHLQKFRDFVVITAQVSREVPLRRSLTVRFTAPWRTVRVKGSLADGIYNLRRGEVLLEVWPGEDVIVENLEGKSEALPETAWNAGGVPLRIFNSMNRQ